MKFRTLFVLLAVILLFTACGPMPTPEPNIQDSETAAQQQIVTEELSDAVRQALIDQYGFAFEPEAIAERITRANDPAALEYVYLISPYTGEIILRATAVGKVVSTSKRLDVPQTYELSENTDLGGGYGHVWLEFERIGNDGSYGSSTPRLFWFDTSGQKFEVAVGGATLVTTERPYTFENNTVDMSVDIRLQGQIDPLKEAQRIAIAEYIHNNSDWRPGDEIPLDVLLSAWELYGDGELPVDENPDIVNPAEEDSGD